MATHVQNLTSTPFSRGHYTPHTQKDSPPKFPSVRGTSKVKRRISHACDRCRMMRTKCSGGEQCSKCIKDNANCVYGDRKRERNKKYNIQGTSQHDCIGTDLPQGSSRKLRPHRPLRDRERQVTKCSPRAERATRVSPSGASRGHGNSGTGTWSSFYRYCALADLDTSIREMMKVPADTSRALSHKAKPAPRAHKLTREPPCIRGDQAKFSPKMPKPHPIQDMLGNKRTRARTLNK